MKPTKENLAQEMRLAKSLSVDLPKSALRTLNALIRRHEVSLANGDVKYLDGCWYVTHTGLLSIAVRRHCVGIDVRPSLKSCDPASSRWVFRATVFRTKTCKGFVGYGDADPSNVSPRVRGAEMRMAETRAVNRALRKAYGIGLCSVEELGWEPRAYGPSDPQKARSASHNYGHQSGKPDLKLVGWTKATELVKVARRDREQFDCATWLHKATALPKEEFKREVEKHLTGLETEPWEIIYFKVFKSQIQVIEQAIETATLMLGSDKSRGFCLEMICADFLAGSNLESGDTKALLLALERLFGLLPSEDREEFLNSVGARERS